MDGQEGPGYAYGRIEIFLRGLWRTISDFPIFTPDAAKVACTALGFGGGAAMNFDFNQVLVSSLFPDMPRVELGCTEIPHASCECPPFPAGHGTLPWTRTGQLHHARPIAPRDFHAAFCSRVHAVHRPKRFSTHSLLKKSV